MVRVETMGTRGLLLFIRKGRRIGIYNQFDSQPEYLGIQFLEFLKKLLENGTFNDFVEKLFNIEPEETVYNVDAMKVLDEIMIGKVSRYCNAEQFQYDDLFCEWSYTLDIDINTIFFEESGGRCYKSIMLNIPNINKAIEFFATS